MIRYIVRRGLWILFIIAVITGLAFVIFFVLPPGDPAVTFAGRNPSPATVAAIKRALGLDKPLYVQYGRYMRHLFLGDKYGWPGLGFSFTTGTPIKQIVFPKILISLQLAAGAAVIWMIVGISIGIVSALKRRSLLDRAAMGFALFGVSAPVFWLGLMALFIFWSKLHWAPGTGFVNFSQSPFQWFTHLLMPWFVLAFLFAAFYARMVRGNMIEVMNEDYIRTARAKGLPERTVIMKHGLRASITPVVTMFGIDFGTLVGTAIVTEKIFNIPGIGNYTITAVYGQDLPSVLAITVFVSISVTLMNLVVDILYAYLDPRVRYA
jgi:peptide/nickel transport system permease protein